MTNEDLKQQKQELENKNNDILEKRRLKKEINNLKIKNILIKLGLKPKEDKNEQ